MEIHQEYAELSERLFKKNSWILVGTVIIAAFELIQPQPLLPSNRAASKLRAYVSSPSALIFWLSSLCPIT